MESAPQTWVQERSSGDTVIQFAGKLTQSMFGCVNTTLGRYELNHEQNEWFPHMLFRKSKSINPPSVDLLSVWRWVDGVSFPNAVKDSALPFIPDEAS